MYTEGGEDLRAVGDESTSYNRFGNSKTYLELPTLSPSVNYS